MTENLPEDYTTTSSDSEILEGFFFHSRYITKSVLNRYGLNPLAYKTAPSADRMCALKKRLQNLIEEKNEINVKSQEELHNLLGLEFSWVCIV